MATDWGSLAADFTGGLSGREWLTVKNLIFKKVNARQRLCGK